MRFNNSIAVIMLAAAQIALLTGADTFGWILAGIVVLAATVALLGFCVGCFIFYRLRLAQFRLKQAPH
jgi:NhaP-type Na+/H+ or K+/H+ antiporter